jgi:hypothetical protein
MKYIIPAAVAIGVGLVTLASYFIQLPMLVIVREVFTGWAVVLAALAVLIGLLNLIVVNFRRIQTNAKGGWYSLLTVVAAVGTFFVGSAETLRNGSPALYSEGSLTNTLFSGVVISSQAALAGLVMIFLVVAAVKMLRTKLNRWSIIFLTVVVIVLIGWIPLSFMRPVNALREWMIAVPVSAGARGILLGVALGTLMIGLRVLLGIERPYKD